ncbi:hypothetical protein AB0O34_36060 [Sphaerisporangium sp. NPDC088356]|uniref:hypothetical protein n=1 Tax=Sphaerisporangium sp. NPDC088356 TaxID=3154871 RepID=UPI00343B6BB8
MADHTARDDVFIAGCRARPAFDLAAGTWDAVVLWTLRDGPYRPGDLQEEFAEKSSGGPSIPNHV